MNDENDERDRGTCKWSGCSKPAHHYRWGKPLCTVHYNDELRRHRRRRFLGGIR